VIAPLGTCRSADAELGQPCGLPTCPHRATTTTTFYRTTRFTPLTGERPAEASFIQRVGFPHRKGLASQRESSLALWEVTNTAKRRQSDRQAPTQVKRTSPVKVMEQMPTEFPSGKAPVGAGNGDCAGESAGVEARGMPGKGWVEELGKPTEVSLYGE